MVYTYYVPTARGYYYLAVSAENEDDAFDKAVEVGGRLGMGEGVPKSLSTDIVDIDNLVIDDAFRNRFRKFGYAHRFVSRQLPPFHERFGYRASLPE